MAVNTGIVFVLVLLVSQDVHSATNFVEYVYVMEMGSFLQYITDIGQDLRSCQATFYQDDEVVSFSLDLTNPSTPQKPTNFEDNENLFNRLTSLGQNLCGFKLVNWSSYDPTRWTLGAVDGLNDAVDTFFQVTQFTISETQLYKNITVAFGSSTTINCGRTDISETMYMCKLFNPSGELVTTSCSYLLTVTMTDVGEWRCLVGVIYSMELIEYVVNLKLEDVTYTVGWAKDEGDYYSVGCQIVNDKSSSSLDHCIITDPLDKDYIIRVGATTERYNTLQTNLDQRICGLEQIPKPLLSTEQGLWRCKIGSRGKIIYVENSTVPDYKKHITISTALNRPITIQCEVPYSALYCHITAPDGTRHQMSFTNENLVDFGQCSHSISYVSEEDKGIWKCSFAKENDTTLEDIEVDLQIIDALVFDEEIFADKNEELEITCRSGGDPGVPVSYCLFVSPQNVSYYLYEDLNTAEITYIGKGFGYGDCSIRINNVQSEHFGNWTCSTKIGIASDISVTILVSTESLSGTTLGLLIALAVILGIILLAATVIITNKIRKSKNAMDVETTMVGRNSNGGSQDEATRSSPQLSETDVRQRK